MATVEDVSASPTKIGDDLVRDKAVRLFRYLCQLAKLRSKTIRDIASYQAVFWLNDLPHEQECFTHAWGENGDEAEPHWLRIDKPERPDAPPPPPECRRWVVIDAIQDFSTEPALREEITESRPSDGISRGDDEEIVLATVRLMDHPDVVASWSRYLLNEWRAWATEQQRRGRVHEAYRRLFAVYQEQQRRGEQHELVLGFGALLWTSTGGHYIHHPVVTSRVTIVLDAQSGRITVAPTVDGPTFGLEQDMLEVNERPPSEEQEDIKNALAELDSPWTGALSQIVRRWLNALPAAADSIYRDTLVPPEGVGQAPKMAFAPVLVLRRRGAQTMRTALDEIAKRLAQVKPIPKGIQVLCSESRKEKTAKTPLERTSPPVDEVLFPLPTNDEQVEILHRLAARPGVLVQGPPGTGKSHTIANLICHLLASGKRVLVTSQTPRALRVLRDKIPHQIRSMTVSLLGEDTDSQVSREEAVQTIHRRHYNDKPEVLQRNADEKAEERRILRSELADLRRQLREIRESEARGHQIPGTPYKGTPQAIAIAVVADEVRLNWYPDDVATDAARPITDDEAKELFVLRRDSGELPQAAVASLPTIAEFQGAVDRYAEVTAALSKFEKAAGWEFARQLSTQDRQFLDTLCEIAEAFAEIFQALDRRSEPWIESLRREHLCHRSPSLAAIAKATDKALDVLAACSTDAEERDLERPPGISRVRMLSDASELLRHFALGRSLGVWPFRARVVRRSKYLWRETFFKGKRCDSRAVVESLVIYLRNQDVLDRAWQEWSSILPAPTGTALYRVARLTECCTAVKQILQLGELQSKADGLFSAVGGNPRAAAAPDWSGQFLGQAPQIARCLADFNAAEEALRIIADRIARSRSTAGPHKTFDELVEAAARHDARSYGERMEMLLDERRRIERRDDLDKRLRRSAPNLADSLDCPQRRAALAPRIDSFSAAWAWKKARTWLDAFVSRDSREIESAIARKETRLQQLTSELAGIKAWLHCLQKLEDDSALIGALTAWSKEVEDLGKGTGKHADTHRRNARQYLQQCSTAIPAWIMPLYRVVEQVEPREEVFDVVIVDEASQTGPEGLILQYLGKQCIIVGDDKQISPEGGFIDGHQISALIRQYIDDIPFAATITPASSLFDQAEIRYGNRITLREHFRCMPEIIRFSNDLSYAGTPLIPLRQYPPSRLPPIQVRFVRDGFREGTAQRAINRPEAAAIARAVIDCLNDTRYSGKSFGVICLQGHAQAHLIESMLLEKLGPAPFKDSSIRLLCGDPYSFQGDERDVVFLSMVAAVEGESRSGPLTHDQYRKRFNVAVSRARDQLWLFHSIREADLSPGCMRRQLISYCYNHDTVAEPPPDDAYDTDFERHVAEELRCGGYRVKPQFEVAGRRIDLVIEDGERKIAIECDGDRWHGPDRYEADMARQRMLERCGWRFIRVRGSAFYANRPKATSQIIETLRALGVEPRFESHCSTESRAWAAEVCGRECMNELGKGSVGDALNPVVQKDFFSASADNMAKPDTSQRTTEKPPIGSQVLHDHTRAVKDKSPAPSSVRKQPASVSHEERSAVVTALKKATEPLGIPVLAARVSSLRLTNQRLKDVVDALIDEGTISRNETPKGPRYLLH